MRLYQVELKETGSGAYRDYYVLAKNMNNAGSKAVRNAKVNTGLYKPTVVSITDLGPVAQ